MPDYVDDWLIAKWMGVTVGELNHMPHWEVDQARIVRHAEFRAQEAANKKQAKKSGKR